VSEVIYFIFAMKSKHKGGLGVSVIVGSLKYRKSNILLHGNELQNI